VLQKNVCLVVDLLCLHFRALQTFSKEEKPKIGDGSGTEFQRQWKEIYGVTDRNVKHCMFSALKV
jgi:hypothetical protein